MAGRFLKELLTVPNTMSLFRVVAAPLLALFWLGFDWRVAGLVDPEPCASAGLRFDRVEWLSEHRDDYDPADFSFRIRAARRDEHLYLFVEVVDDELIVRQRDLDDGDQLRIVVALPAEGGASLPVRFVTSYRPGGIHRTPRNFAPAQPQA